MERFLEALLSSKPSEHSDIFLEYIPELKPCVGFNHNHPWHHLDVWNHILLTMDLSPNDKIIRMALLLHDIAKPDTMTIDAEGISHYKGHPEKGYEKSIEILKRFSCFSEEEKKKILLLIKNHDNCLGLTYKTLKRKLINWGEETVDRMLKVQRADALAHNPEKIASRVQMLEEIEEKIEEIKKELREEL